MTHEKQHKEKKHDPKGLKDFKNHKIETINSLDGFPEIHGIDLDEAQDLDKFIRSLGSNGFQATHIGRAIEVFKTMIREKATIFLAFTSNQITSGNREIIKYLIKHKLVHVVVTTAGGIEEDIIKCFKPFVIGDFEVSGRGLFEKGINRTGNIFVPCDRYLNFENFMNPFLEECYQEEKKTGEPMTVRKLLYEMGKKIDNEDSYLYWAYKNDIPVFCPALTDGSMGDMIYFFKYRRPDFVLDITTDMREIVDIAINAPTTGCFILGGGVAKHHTLNANIYRDGCDYLVLVNTGQEFDGSDSGARVDESVSWGKVKINAMSVKVYCDATIAFPLIVTGALNDLRKDEENNKEKKESHKPKQD